MNRIQVASGLTCALLWCYWLTTPARTDQAEGVADDKTIEVPSQTKLGRYVVHTPGEPIRFTVRDAMTADRDAKYKAWDFVDRVSYPRDKVLAIALDDDRSSAGERLKKLSRIPVDDVHFLTVFGELDKESLEIIASYTKLRLLTIDASPILETAEGASSLERLSALEYLFVIHPSERAFGNRRFCEAIAKLKSLRFLSFPADGLTNAQVQIIATSPSLESVHIHTTKGIFSGGTLRAFQRLKSLKELSLFCTADISSEDLNGFSTCKALELLAIQSEADPAIANPLRRLLPDCKVYVVSPEE